MRKKNIVSNKKIVILKYSKRSEGNIHRQTKDTDLFISVQKIDCKSVILLLKDI